MLTPLSRLRDARSGNPRAAAVTVFAGDLQDVCNLCPDPKEAPVAACLKLALPAERPGVQLRVPGEHLDKLIELGSLATD